MKNFKLLSVFVVFVSLCAFQCEDDQACDTLDDYRSTFDLELSSTESTFEVDDQLVITATFSAVIPSQFTDLDYSVEEENVFYDFELFEVQADNQPVKSVGDKIELSSASAITEQEDGIFNNLRISCKENCSFEFKLDLKEAGYYGLVFKTGDFVSMVDCAVVTVTGGKTDVQNFDILDEIGTQTISYSTSNLPVAITPTNSFFFKVE